jgi:hypothetical protein
MREGSYKLQLPENDCVASSAQTGAHGTVRLGELELQMKWPPHSPDLTPCDCFLWGYVKERAFVAFLPLELRITAVIETIDRNLLESVWDELDYILGICRVTKGAHV